jgi:hypothetical protein
MKSTARSRIAAREAIEFALGHLAITPRLRELSVRHYSGRPLNA